MENPNLEADISFQMDQNPLLVAPMGSNDHEHEHVIDLITDNDSSSLLSNDQPFVQNPEQHEDPIYGFEFIHRGGSYGDNNRRLDSSFPYLSIELIAICQIMLSSLIIWLAGADDVPTPLFTWVASYACSCVATLSTQLWRHWNCEWNTGHLSGAHQNSSNSNRPESSDLNQRGHLCILFEELMVHFKIVVDFIFAWWFIIGDILFFEDSPPTQTAAIIRVLIMFLALSCIYHSMPIGMFAILSFFFSPMAWVTLWEEHNERNVATSVLFNYLPSYKVKKLYCGDGGLAEGEGGLLAKGNAKERIISQEDAFCCICLADYAENDEIRELPCLHIFHVGCVDRWININAACPLCRNEVRPLEAGR